MSLPLTPQVKVGIFVVIVLIILAYATVRISQTSLIPGGTYSVYLLIESASGITKKAAVQIAGIQVGSVVGVDLADNNEAKVELEIRKNVKISKDVEARIKTVGILGDTYIELFQPGPVVQALPHDSTISRVVIYGDFSSVTNELAAITRDVKAITGTMRNVMAGEESSFANSLRNIERITDALSDVSVGQQGNLNAIIENFKSVAENLNLIVARNASNVDTAMENVAAITEKVRSGEGTIGRLLNDDETVEKLNESIDNLNALLGSTGRTEIDLGYHAEYLSVTDEFKNYVSLKIKPRPDKYFLFEFVDDPAPDATRSTKQTTITSGGASTTVTEETTSTEFDKFRFSAQFAKKFYGFTLRGGLIESSGGAGLDYELGPLGIEFSAFDFETKRGERPHLKTMGTINLTQNIYLLGGVDDFISNQQAPDWFLGAGLNITDEDLKSILGLMSLKP